MKIDEEHCKEDGKYSQEFINDNSVVVHQTRGLFPAKVADISLDKNLQKNVPTSSKNI